MPKNKITYTKKFDEFQKLLLNAYNTFAVWKALQNEEYNETYKKHTPFWSAVLYSLQESWLLALARLYEESNYSKAGRVISVSALILDHPNQTRAKKAGTLLKENKTVLENIGKLRHHQLAHNNTAHLIDPKKLLTKFPIKYDEVDKIFKFTAELLSALNPQERHSYTLGSMDEAKMSTKDLIKNIQYYQAKKREHLDKFTRGEIDSYKFLPDVHIQ